MSREVNFWQKKENVMKKKSTLISGMTSLILLGLATTSFAGMGIPNNSPNIGTEAGVEIVASPKAVAAAASYDYRSLDLLAMGTEAGSDIIGSEKAKTAGANFDYNSELLVLIGTEAGQSPTGVELDTNTPCRC
jgi:hypothetical protein